MQKISHHNPWLPQPAPRLSPLQKHWMMRTGALTQGLRLLGSVQLRVVAEYSIALNHDEAHCLNLHRGTLGWVREVAMSLNDQDCIVARSVTSLVGASGVWQGIRRLKARPLADLLYEDRTIRRSSFEVLSVRAPAALFKLAQQHTNRHLNQSLCARRSVFWRTQVPLLVSECFLPDFWKIVQGQRAQGASHWA
jgi:chorismate--pyruvate lyase